MWKNIIKLVKKWYPSKALILMYHRVDEEGMDPWALCVTPKNFEEHLSVIREHANPVSLEGLIEEMRTGKITPHSIVVTFDDGYLNNLLYAKPLLEKYSIPATFFITSGKIGGNREFWWDQLEQIFLTAGELPQTLTLQINNTNYEWKLGKASIYSSDELRKDLKLKVWKAPPGSRHFFYNSIWQKLHPLSDKQKTELIEKIVQWSGSTLQLRETHRVLTKTELKKLGDNNLLEIGAHTVTHPTLKTQKKQQQEEEIVGSKESLERILNRQITSFAYPHGEYSSETIEILNSSGFTCACTTSDEPLRLNHNYLKLPRLHVNDWSGEQFFKVLNKLFHI